MNHTMIICDERGDSLTISLATPSGILRTRIGPGPGHVVRRSARHRRMLQALEALAFIIRHADAGRVYGVLLGEPSPTGEVGMSIEDGRLVASELRRCSHYLHENGLPPAGARVCLDDSAVH